MTDRTQIPDHVKQAFDESSKYFETPIQLVQFMDKYSRWRPELGRRETWAETVQRAVDFLDELSDYKLPERTMEEIHRAMLEMRVMPSMRLLAMAGEAARRDNISIYNCAAQGLDHPYAFVEGLLISMAGAGFGYSVERRFVDKLPVVGKFSWTEPWCEFLFGEIPMGVDGPIVRAEVSDNLKMGARDESLWTWIRDESRHIFKLIVRDSADGWAEALAVGLASWWSGYDSVEFDFSQIRPKGSQLKTKGGTASGPEPLRELLDFARELILGARGRKLRPIEAHDLMCKIADCVVSGGVRRSAMIALFDFDDDEMMNAKPFGFWDDPKLAHRKNANNSAVMPEIWQGNQADAMESTLRQMIANHSGEPGIFSRRNAWATMPERRRILDKVPCECLSAKSFDLLQRSNQIFGEAPGPWCHDCQNTGFLVGLKRPNFELLTNPCGEIYLRHGQFCNLSIVVARPEMEIDDYFESVRLATIIGTIQACATSFPGLRSKWRENCELERLLGVDITGQADVQILSAELLTSLRFFAESVNRDTAKTLDINPAAAITCVKPGGNSSVLLGCTSGLSEDWAPWFIRRMTLDRDGAVAKMLRASGWELEDPEFPNDGNRNHVYACFPMKAKNPSRTKRNVSAVSQCETWLKNKLCWTEHNPSCTITYREHEIEDLIAWVREHHNVIGGMAFLPAADGIYPNAPNQTITAEEYQSMVDSLPSIDVSRLWTFEDHDTTTVAREVACSAGACEML